MQKYITQLLTLLVLVLFVLIKLTMESDFSLYILGVTGVMLNKKCVVIFSV